MSSANTHPAGSAGRRGYLPDLLMLLVVTVLFGLWGGAVYYHPDEILDEAMHALVNHGDPEYFHYPGLVIYLHALLYRIILSVAGLFGMSSDPQYISQIFQKLSIAGHSISPDDPAHFLIALLAFMGVACSYLAVQRVTGKRWLSLLAGAFVATSLTWVRNCHFDTVDVPLASFCVATVLVSLRIFSGGNRPGTRQLILLGVMVGLTTSVKYNGALIAAAVAAPLMIQEYRNPMNLIKKGLLSGAAAVAIFLITNPYIIIDYSLFREHLASRVVEIHDGRPGFYMSNGWLFHLYYSLGEGYGFIPLLLAFAGMGWVAFSRKLELVQKVILLLFPVLFFAVMGNSKAAFIRHILPVVPFAGIFSALGAWCLIRGVKSAKPYRPVYTAAAITVSLAFVPNAWLSIQHNMQLKRGDTRKLLEQVFREVDLDWRSVELYCGRYTKRCAVESDVKPSRFLTSSFSLFPERDHLYVLHRTKPEIVVLDDFSHDRLLERFPRHRPTYMLEGMCRVAISPFNVPKADVPVSHDSVYSPCPPDLAYRNMAGPYIEILTVDRARAERFQEAGLRIGLPMEIEPGETSYFKDHMKVRAME